MRQILVKNWKRFVAGFLALTLTIGVISIQSTEAKAATNVTLSLGSTGLGMNDEFKRYNIFFDVNGADISSFAGDVADNTVYLDGKPIIGGSSAVEYHLVGAELLLCVYYNAVEAGKTTAASIGEHTLIIPAGTVIGSGSNQYITNNDMGFYINGTTIQEKKVVTFETTETNVYQDWATRYQMWFSAPAGVLATGISEGTIPVIVDGNSATATWAVSGDNLLFLLPYSKLEAGATAASSIGSHTVTIPSGTLLSSGFIVKNTLTYAINGTTVTPSNETTDTTPYTDFQISEINANTSLNGTTWFMYFNVDADMPGEAWGADEYYTVDVLVNNEAKTVTVKKANERLLFMEIPQSYLAESGNTTVVIKAGEYKNNLQNFGLNLTSDYAIMWNGSSWGLPVTEPVYTDLTVNSLNSSFHDEFNRWNIILGTDHVVPGENFAASFETLEVTINGETVALPEGFFRSDDNQLFLYIPAATLGKELTANTEIVIKGGILASEAQGVGINVQQDITIYANEYGWSLDGFIEAPETVSLKFTGLDAATGYSSIRSAWHFYMQPTESLPGIADQSKYFGVKAVYNGTELTVNIDKAAHNDTAFLEILDSVIPKEMKENVTLTIKAGTYTDTSTGGIMILEEDFVIYGNEYGWSADGYITKPTVTTVTFTGINQASAYSERTQSWHLYLTPSETLPGVADSTVYRMFTVEANGTMQELEMWKSAHENTAFVEIPSTLLPKNITKNIKLIFKTGTAVGSDNKNAIKLEKELVIYVNQYGFSLDGFMQAPTVYDKDVTLTLDRYTLYGGNNSGIYLDTTDGFAVDTTWITKIKASAYDSDAGVYYNGKKVDAALKRYADGKAYLSLADVGITAQDKDKVTIKGVFSLGTYGVSYKEVSFYFNGKIWNTTYETAKSETYAKITGVSLNNVSKWSDTGKRWAIYINVEGQIPGEIDMTSFNYLQVEINGKVVETTVSHSYQDTLFVPIYEKDLAKNAKDGTKITIKAGKALAADMSTGIQWMKDFTFYTYKGTLSELEPTTDAKWIRTDIEGTNGAGYYNPDAKEWYLFFVLKKDLATEKGTLYAGFPVVINGKTYTFIATQDGEYLRIQIPESIIPKNTMNNMKIEVNEGTKIYANAGRNGVEFTSGWTGYVYNRVITEDEISEIKDSATNITGVQNVTSATTSAGAKVHHVYLHTDSKLPGTEWYEHYTDFVYYYNGNKITSELVKATSSTDKLIYFPIVENKTGAPKDGDIIMIKAGTVVSAGGNKVTIENEFKIVYLNGVWSEYVETDAQKPEKTGSLWSEFRFEEGYIPVGEDDGSVLGTNESTFNTIYSIEKHKDYTMSFRLTKKYDDEVTAPMSVILRGTPVEEGEKLDSGFLNGYVITLSGNEITNNDGEDIWQQTIHIWKNGQNVSLVDQYRVFYETRNADHPFFQYGETYDYEISIYNVAEESVCIEISVNGELVVRYYDDASGDSYDPVINEGTFAISYGCPSYLTDTIDTSLTEVISAVDECVVGEQVQFAVTYPFVLNDSEFSVNKEGATIKDGVFTATEPGTYTVLGSYKGTKLAEKTIVVKEAPEEQDVDGESTFPIIPIVITGVTLLFAIVVAIILIMKKRSKKDEK